MRRARLVFLSLLALPSLAFAHPEGASKPARTAEEALRELKAGNARFVAGKPIRRHSTVQRVKETAGAQKPEAIVLGCADSRVPPEIVFDEGIGDLFVVRVAGNVSEPATLGSIEYAAEHLGVPLIVVLGHHGCGAIKAAAEAGSASEGNVGALVKEIHPAIARARQAPAREGLLNDAAHVNVELVSRQLLDESPMLKHLADQAKVKVVTAVYDLESGRVEWGE
jgi:carbonic anhydrase